MIKIYKYEFSIDDRIRIMMPIDAEILKVECQGRTPCLWAKVNTEYGSVERDFLIYATGEEIHPFKTGKHIATFQQGGYVWHMFEPY